jgi:hypothetical protein
MQILVALLGFVESTRHALWNDDEGLSTAELLGNAALAIGALVVIWGVLEVAGVNIVGWIEDQVTGN